MAFGAFTVTRSTTKWVLNSAGVLSQVAINTPAFEFNANGTYRGLLVEPGATNLALRSAEFDNASWAKTAAGTASAPVVTANAAVAPDGTTTADLIVFDRGAGNTITDNSQFSQAATVVNATVYTASFWLKAATGADVGKQIGIRGVAGVGYGVITLTADWVRYTRTETSTSTSGSIQLGNRGTITVDNTVSVHAWGAQLETGSVATSYIPTVASTETRTADSVTLTGASSLIGQTQGTIYAEVNVSRLGLEGYIFRADDTSLSNFITIRKLATNEIRAVITATTSAGTVNLSSAPVTTGIVKIAYAYTSGSIAISVNGSSPTVVTGTFSFGTALSRMYLGIDISSTPWNDTVRAYALFPTRLANATLQALTA